MPHSVLLFNWKKNNKIYELGYKSKSCENKLNKPYINKLYGMHWLVINTQTFAILTRRLLITKTVWPAFWGTTTSIVRYKLKIYRNAKTN